MAAKAVAAMYRAGGEEVQENTALVFLHYAVAGEALLPERVEREVGRLTGPALALWVTPRATRGRRHLRSS